MDRETRELARGSFRHLIAETPAERVVGELRDAGWRELFAEDRGAAVSLLFEEQGRSLAATPALDAVVLSELGLELEPDVAIVYPPLADRDPLPGTHGASSSQSPPPAFHATSLREAVRVDGIALRGVERASRLRFATATSDGEISIATVSAAASGLRLVKLAGFDPDLGLVGVSGEVGPHESTTEAAADRWQRALASARRALAHELLGVAEKTTENAVEHVKLRKQFGRPIAAFQAVKHRLAEVYVATASTRTVLGSAWESDDPLVAALAKAEAGRAALLAARHCPQVCGGMGFTWEFGMHRYARRAIVLDSLLGASRGLCSAIGTRLLDTRVVPRLGELSSREEEIRR